jgi:hypothetical protein
VLGGRGDDSVGLTDHGTDTQQGTYTYDGGPGRDYFGAVVDGRGPASMLVDLGARKIDVGDDSAAFDGFEHLALTEPHGAVGVKGTPGRDQLFVTAGSVTATLGDGADDLLVTRSSQADVDLGPGPDRLRLVFVRHGATARLGNGDDLVSSSNSATKFGLQILYGGAGHDTARLMGTHFALHSIEKVTHPG